MGRNQKPIGKALFAVGSSYMNQTVHFRIDSSVQPILVTVESNHRLINRNVIRTLSRFWL